MRRYFRNAQKSTLDEYVAPEKPSDNTMKQQPLTIIVPVSSSESAKELLAVLENGVAVDAGSRPIDFSKTPSTHFARFVFLPGANAGYEGSRLLFSSNFDGERDGYVKELASNLGPEMARIWQHCKGYKEGLTSDHTLFLNFINAYAEKINTFYAALPGVTVTDICSSAAKRANFEIFLDSQKPDPISENTPKLKHVKAGPSKKQGFVNSLLGALEWLVGVRTGVQMQEAVVRTDPKLYGIEDVFVQNQMTVIVPIRRNPVSWVMARLVLWAINKVSQGARGSLSGITTIHFARWAIIDGGRNLLFESNYDGSWESYIDDFVDSASVGMNLIWGNCVGFPKGGSRDVEAFKAYIRANQIPSQLFYSAYQDLTMRNILTDLSINDAVPAYFRAGGEEEFRMGIYPGA